ncbi:MAG: TRAP transporter large permease [Burkholderiaceae bacterium]|nr:TRAP transporter large permease [Burkholderiaceae bacterium]
METWHVGFALLIVLIMTGMPIAFAMGIVGLFGSALYLGLPAALNMVGQITYETGLSYELSVIPLFILMGSFVTRSGMSDELYAAANAWLGHRRGGLAQATVVACAGFSSVCGSSVATAATMTKVAMKPMLSRGYAPSLATGSIAAGGTLGILIPPSVVLVIYGLMTQTDIGKLFMAGVLPGLLGALGYITAVWLMCLIDPKLGPRGERLPYAERFRALRGVLPILGLFTLVIGGLYVGIFTATEAAGIGAFGAFVFALWRRALTPRLLLEVLIESGTTTSMIFIVVIGALIFGNYINLSGLPETLTAWVMHLDVPPLVVIFAIALVYLVLGAVLESFSMILLTVPIFYPLVSALGMDLIWFGIIVVVVTEISLISPPVGMNVFVMRSLLPEVPTGVIFRGVMPFLAMDVVRLTVLILVPWISLVLPSMMK